MVIGALIAMALLYQVMRLTASAGSSASFPPASARVAPAVQSPTARIEQYAPPGLREEGDARRKAEDRAAAAEQRLTVIQEQYRKTLEELHVTQRLIQERPQPGAPDPAVEGRLLKAEGQARLLEGQLKAMSAERDKLARHIADQAKNKPDTDAEADRRNKQVEQEAIGLRAELEGAQTELSLTRRELDALKAEAARAQEMHQDLDAAHVDALHTRESLEASQAELSRANKELDDARTEIRALRAEEQRASVLSEEVRSARAELDSLKASHRAELIEREADLEDRVRRAREEFQTQLAETGSQSTRQLAEREAALAKETAERIASLQAEATARENELQHRLAEREATLQEEMAQQAASLEQRLSEREDELTRQLTEAEHAAKAVRTELGGVAAELEETRASLQAARDEIAAVSHDGSSQHEQLAKANDELLRSRTEIETLQHELADAQRKREQVERDQAQAATERDEAHRELAATSAEVQTELARGVELAARADTAEQELRTARERADEVAQEFARLVAERNDLTRSIAERETRHAAELAAAAAAPNPDTEEVLRASQERLASQTEKLIEVEERAHASERQLADTVVRLEEVEGELRHLQMEKALHDLQSERPAETASPDLHVPGAEHPDDRRSSSPFTRELSLDAKKSLSHIMGLTQIMKFKKDSKDQAQLIKQLTAAARRLDHTVSDIADADSLAQGAVELTIKRTDLEALVKRVVDESGVGADHDVRIDSQAVVVAVDALRVEQVLAGMLRTSGDRTPPGKAITVRLANANGGAVLSVEDPEPASDGALSIVTQRFVEMQGGWARVEGRDGGGVAFKAFFPDGGPSGDAPAEPPELDAADDDAPKNTLQIVVAEPSEEEAAASETWGESEEQLLVQELHRLHAED
jgi:chromosome segregation ATPase